MTKHTRGRSGGRKSRKIERVRKRDGRCVPFQPEKIEVAIRAALGAVGEPDDAFAAELAGVVELSLAERVKKRLARGSRASAAEKAPDRHHSPEGVVPTIEEIQDLVERALMELGRPRVAKAYILYRDRRSRIREAVRVHRSEALHARIRVRENEGVSSWSKGRIVAALMEEAELSREASEEVASSVEHRVFDSGARCITTGWIRELVAAELFERGWIRALSATRVVGLSRCDLERTLSGSSLDPWHGPEPLSRRGATAAADTPAFRRSARDVGARLSGELLRRFVLEDVLFQGASELHRSGDLHIVGLEHPQMPLSLCAPAELLAGSDRSVAGAFDLMSAAGELAREVAEILVLERPARLLEPLLNEAGNRSLEMWLRGLTAISKSSGTRIALGSCSDAPTSLTAGVVEVLADRAGDPACPWLLLEGSEIEELLGFRPDLVDVVECLFAQGLLRTVWGSSQETYAGPGCHRFGREPGVLSCGGAIALNLPRLARRAGPWREGMVLSGLAELVGASIELARDLARLQDEIARPPAGLHTRRAFALVPVGLREALGVLGDGAFDPEVGARLVGMLSEAAKRFTAQGATDIIGVDPCSLFAHDAALRFAWLDARKRRAGGHQGWLFEDAEYHRDRPRPYTTAIRISPFVNPAGMYSDGVGGAGVSSGRAEAEVSKTLSAGSFSLVGLPSAESRSVHPHIDVWRRFEERRREFLGGAVVELFPAGPVAPAGQSSSPESPDVSGIPPSSGSKPSSLRPLV